MHRGLREPACNCPSRSRTSLILESQRHFHWHPAADRSWCGRQVGKATQLSACCMARDNRAKLAGISIVRAEDLLSADHSMFEQIAGRNHHGSLVGIVGEVTPSIAMVWRLVRCNRNSATIMRITSRGRCTARPPCRRMIAQVSAIRSRCSRKSSSSRRRRSAASLPLCRFAERTLAKALLIARGRDGDGWCQNTADNDHRYRPLMVRSPDRASATHPVFARA